MRKIAFLVATFLFSSQAFAGFITARCFENTNGKGSWSVKVKHDNATIFNKSSNLSKNTAATPAQDVMCVYVIDTDGTPGTITESPDATFPGAVLYTVEVDDTKTTSLEIQVSGKLSGFGDTSGNGVGFWKWSGTTSLILLSGMPEIHGLTNLSNPYGSCANDAVWCSATGNPTGMPTPEDVWEAACSVTCTGNGG